MLGNRFYTDYTESHNGKNKYTVNYKMPRTLLLSLLAVVLVVGTMRSTSAQSSDPNWKPVGFKPPTGYMPADFPEKRPGKLLLNPKRPAGMFIVYPKDGENLDVLQNLLKSTVAGMFFHDSKTPVDWTASSLPAHEGTENESGMLYSASNGKMQIQLALYARTFGVTKLLYGYYGMSHKSEKRKDDAPFMDTSGKGAEDFDKFRKSIKISE
jgi:hypothetical protein